MEVSSGLRRRWWKVLCIVRRLNAFPKRVQNGRAGGLTLTMGRSSFLIEGHQTVNILG